MTEIDLTDRLREAIVLDGPDAWQRNGYLQEAEQLGLSTADAEKQAHVINQEVRANSLLYQNILARIERMAQPSRAHLYEQDLSQIVNAAGSLKLSPDFVRNQWVPKVIAKIAPPAVNTAVEEETDGKAATVQPVPEVTTPTRPTDFFAELMDVAQSQPGPVTPDRSTATAPPPSPVAVTRPESGYARELGRRETSRPYESPPVVRSYTATPNRIQKGQGVTLEWDVENLLAVTIDDLGEGLSPKNRGWVKPNKTTDYTLFDANNNPLSTVRVVVIPPDRSGVYGVLFALAILALIYWFVKHNNAPREEPELKKKERTSWQERSATRRSIAARRSRQRGQPTSVDTTSGSTIATLSDVGRATPVADSRADRSSNEPPVRPETPAEARQGKYEEAFGDKPYDKVELGADEQGWRRARANGRWGYVDANDEWVIEPVYEAITPFRGNRAAAFQNGQLTTINRAGERIANE